MSENTTAAEATPPDIGASVSRPRAPQKNGVSKPSAGTDTGKVWEIADAISAKSQRPAKRSEVIEAAHQLGLSPSTASTQFGRWRKYWGIPAEIRITSPKADENLNGEKQIDAEGKPLPIAEKPKKAKKSNKDVTAAEGREALGEAVVLPAEVAG